MTIDKSYKNFWKDHKNPHFSTANFIFATKECIALPFLENLVVHFNTLVQIRKSFPHFDVYSALPIPLGSDSWKNQSVPVANINW